MTQLPPGEPEPPQGGRASHRHRPRVDRILRLRLVVFAVVAVLAVVVVLVDLVLLGGDALLPVLVSGAVGLAVGLVGSRMYALRWDVTSASVVGRIDAAGVVVLVAYVVFIAFRSRLIEVWVAAPLVGAAGFATLSGLMIGQCLGTLRGISRALALAGLRGRP